MKPLSTRPYLPGRQVSPASRRAPGTAVPGLNGIEARHPDAAAPRCRFTAESVSEDAEPGEYLTCTLSDGHPAATNSPWPTPTTEPWRPARSRSGRVPGVRVLDLDREFVSAVRVYVF